MDNGKRVFEDFIDEVGEGAAALHGGKAGRGGLFRFAEVRLGGRSAMLREVGFFWRGIVGFVSHGSCLVLDGLVVRIGLEENVPGGAVDGFVKVAVEEVLP